jgi:hypothetical protein
MASKDQDALIHPSIPWVASLLVFLLVLLKVLAVAHGDATTIYGLVSASGLTTIILATLGVSLGFVGLLVLYLTQTVLLAENVSAVERVILRVSFTVSVVVAALLLPVFAVVLWYYLLDIEFEGPLFRFLGRFRPTKPPIDSELMAEMKKSVQRLQADGTEMNAIALETEEISETLARARTNPEEIDEEAMDERLSVLKQRTKAVAERVDNERQLGDRSDEEISRARRETDRRRRKLVRLAMLPIATAAVGLLVQALRDEPWIPAERLELSSGDDHPLIAYVVRTESESLLVLRDDPRQLVWLDERDVLERSFCDASPSSEIPLLLKSPLNLLFERPDYPPCTDDRDGD